MTLVTTTGTRGVKKCPATSTRTVRPSNVVFKVSRGKKSEKTKKLRFYRAPRLKLLLFVLYVRVKEQLGGGNAILFTTNLANSPPLSKQK